MKLCICEGLFCCNVRVDYFFNVLIFVGFWGDKFLRGFREGAGMVLMYTLRFTVCDEFLFLIIR